MPEIHQEIGQEIAPILINAYINGGIFGHPLRMPEAELPEGVVRGSREHLLFLTLTVSIDYRRDADQLWDAARATFNDPETRFLFFPEEVVQKDFQRIINAGKKHNLFIRPSRDAKIWITICKTLHDYYQDSPLTFLEDCNFDAPCIQNRLRDYAALFPGLSGDKISALWLRIVWRTAGIELNNLKKISIPVDTHIRRATIKTQVITNREDIPENILNCYVRLAWDLSLQNTERMPLQIDEPLWHLSRYGCAMAQNDCPQFNNCPVNHYCIHQRGV